MAESEFPTLGLQMIPAFRQGAGRTLASSDCTGRYWDDSPTMFSSPHSGGGRAGPEPARHRTREEAEQPRNNTQYSAIPARQFVAITPYHPQAEGEIALCKNDRVKGKSVGCSMWIRFRTLL